MVTLIPKQQQNEHFEIITTKYRFVFIPIGFHRGRLINKHKHITMYVVLDQNIQN